MRIEDRVITNLAIPGFRSSTFDPQSSIFFALFISSWLIPDSS
ncbi:MAG TPA: hypothetical protein VI479_01515 [Blastocatellia bacterium]